MNRLLSQANFQWAADYAEEFITVVVASVEVFYSSRTSSSVVGLAWPDDSLPVLWPSRDKDTDRATLVLTSNERNDSIPGYVP
jgi:Flp pilus assembly protein CpaB